LHIGPNPVAGELQIRYSGGFARFELSILNASGHQVRGVQQFTSSATVDLNGLNTGVYVIRIINKTKGTQVHRLIFKK
ncbi:MAG: T9SS type A sorting domain-containing protein, partial [Pseudobacter sp.]|uniref:T9SS type A sorting domain-containing protein n=1 Tax=Pseudobacter sp. TaxID=2045420 RepID=UPI003F807E61